MHDILLSLTLALTNSTSSSGFVQHYGQQAQIFINSLLDVAEAVVAAVIVKAALVVLSIGILLYFSRAARREGWSLLTGGAILLVLSYTLFPSITGQFPVAPWVLP